MIVRKFNQTCIAATLAMAGFSIGAVSIQAQPDSSGDLQPGVEVLTRGPVHEAFAETVTFDPEVGIVVPRAPRDIIEELPPEYRPDGVNVTWIPGYWAWDDERDDYLWVSGVWRDLPPGRQWVPGYWGQSSQGYRWTSGYWADASVDEVEYLPEPPDSIEIGPNMVAPAANLGWVPGCWMWHQSRYAWRPGYWAAGRPDWIWIPAHYNWAPRGYVYSEGYWDYPVERRGVLFAPVYFETGVYSRRDFHYSPSFSINLAVFSDQLFVRPRYHHYYFGDYYDTRYQNTGFYASFSYQTSRHGYDPIYAHRRWENRRDRDWDRRDRDNFTYRREHPDARPHRTLLAQREWSGRRGGSGETRIEVAASFNLRAKRNDGGARLQRIDRSERNELAQRGRAIQATRGERQKLETRAAASPSELRSRNNEKQAGANESRTGEKVRRSTAVEPARVKLPKAQVVAKPTNQLGKGQAPPKRHKVPEPNPKIEAKPKRANGEQGSRRESDARKGGTNEKKTEPQRGQPRQEPVGKSNGESKNKPGEEKKKSKDEPKKP